MTSYCFVEGTNVTKVITDSIFKVNLRPRVLVYIQSVPGGKYNILGGHSIGHSKQKTLYEHVSYSERFPR
jgi:hypothetical protein